MAVPHTGVVLYTFSPPDDEWTQTHTRTHTGSTATVTGQYILRMTAETDAYTGYVSLCKQASNIGPIYRLHYTFLIDTLPDEYESGETTIVDMGFISSGGTEVTPAVLRVDHAGKLKLYYSGMVDSGANVIIAGNSYTLEVYYRYDPAHVADTICQVYVNGDLWIDDSGAAYVWEEYPGAFAHVRFGWDFDYLGLCDVLVSASNITWTIEDIAAPGRWTMMAVL